MARRRNAGPSRKVDAAGDGRGPEHLVFSAEGSGVDRTTIRFLDPKTSHIHLGNLGSLHVTIQGEGTYGGIYAAYAFPVGTTEAYISLLQVGETKDTEIGVIRDLHAFPQEQAELVRQALKRRYFVHTITELKSITMQYNLLFVEALTDKGPVSFHMRWAQDKAVDYGKEGKVLIDVDDNRYLIPDVQALPARERVEFQRYIYW
jgi:hypothetical protein